MSVTTREIEHIARLARLQIQPTEKDQLARQMNQILDYMEKLNEIDTSDIEPLSHPLELVNVFREDRVQESLPREEALDNAPLKTDKYFRVPRVVNK